MDFVDRYGLSAQYSFEAGAAAFASMRSVQTHLEGIQQAVSATANSLKSSGIGQQLRALGRLTKEGGSTAATQMNAVSSAAREAKAQLSPLRAQFRTLRAEANNIDLNFTDPRQLRQGAAEITTYIESLRKLETQIDATTLEGREFVAQIKAQQRAARQRVDLANQKHAAQEIKNTSAAAIVSTRQLNDLGREFRALRAESRNINFGSLDNPHQFDQAKRSLDEYIQSLRRLEAQIERTTPEGRTLAADIQRQQAIAQNRADIAQNQRAAAVAQQRQGAATGVAAAGTAVALPLIGLGSKSINLTAAFDDQMSAVKAVLNEADRTDENIRRIRESAKQLGAETRYSASDAASGFVLLAQAGYNVDKQLAAIQGTLALAAAGNMALDAATGITVSTLGQFQLEATQATHVADVLAKAAAMGQLDVNDLGMSLKYAGVSANRAKLSLEQTSAMMALLSEGGLKGEMAGTGLTGMIDALAAPTATAAGVLKTLGVRTTDARGRLLPFENILTQVTKQLGRVKDEGRRASLSQKLFGTVGGRAYGILAPRLNRLAVATNEVAGATGSAADQMNIMEDNLGGTFRNLSSAFEGVLLEIGDVLKTIVRPIANAISQILTGFIKLPQPIKTVVVLVGTLAAGLATLAVIGGTVAVAMFGVQSALATAAVGITTMAGAGIPLTGFFATTMHAFATGGIITGFQSLGGAIVGVGTSIGGAATALGSFLVGPIGLTILSVTGILSLVQKLIPQVNILGTILSAIAAPAGFLLGLVTGIAKGIWQALQPLLRELAPVQQALLPIGGALGYIKDAIAQATKTFGQFAGIGEGVGQIIGGTITSLILYPLRLVVWAVRAVIGIFQLFGGSIQGIGKAIFAVLQLFVLNPLRMVGNFAGAIAGGITSAFAGAAQRIQQAWQGFIDWFANLPLVSTAINIGTGLINALNHRPTIVIPASWQGAVELIQGFLNGLLGVGQFVGNALGNLLNPGRLFGGLIDGLISRIQGLVEAVQNSGLGKFFGGATEGLTTFINQLGQISQVAPVTVPVAVEVKPPRKDALLPALASLPPNSGSMAQMEIAQAAAPVSLPVLPALELPDFDSILNAYLKDATAQIQAAQLPVEPIAQKITPVFEQQRQIVKAEMRQTMNTVSTEARQGVSAAFSRITAEWSDRWQFLQQAGKTNIQGLFQPGVEQLHSSFAALQNDVGVFVTESGKALIGLDFERAKAAATDFGSQLKGSIDRAASAMGGLTLSAATFGIFSLVSLSPIALILGGIVLIVAAITTNFLGIRTILTGIVKIVQGVFRFVQGIIEAITALTRGVYQLGRGIRQIFGGILPALRGDFTQIQQGFSTVFGAIRTGADEVRQAIGRSVGGVAQIFRGVGQVGSGVFEGLAQLARGVTGTIKLAFQGARTGADLFAQAVGLARSAFAQLLTLPGRLQEQWQSLQAKIRNLPLISNIQSLENLPQQLTGITTRIQGLWQELVQFLRSPLQISWAALQTLPDRVQGVITQVRQTWRSLVDALHQMPLTASIGNLRQLPETIGAVLGQVRQVFQVGVEQITQIWQSMSQVLNNVPILQEFINFIHTLPQIFSGVVERIQGLWSGLGNNISGFFSRLGGKAKQTGQQLVSDLAENSPGPTFVIRQKWQATTEALTGRFETLTVHAQSAGQKIASSLGGTRRMGQGLGQGVNALGNSFGSLGLVLSNFSPHLAAPLFLASDLGNSFVSLSESLPQTQKLFGRLGPTFTKVSTAGTTAFSGLLASGSTAFAGLATAAGTAWTVVIAPILPFVLGVGLAIGAVALLIVAFRRNFLGIRSFVQGMFALVQGVVQALGNLFNPVFAAIGRLQQAWEGFRSWFGGLMGFLPNLAVDAGQGLINALNHNPTVVIPESWRQAAGQIQDHIQNVVSGAITAGRDISSGMISSIVGTAQQVIQGFSSMALSAVAFGVSSVLSLGPLVLVLGGLALGAIAMITNFLGLRTILRGVFQAVAGIADLAISSILGIIRFVRGFIGIISGIPAALRGDFSQILGGWQQVIGSIQQTAVGLVNALQRIFGGAIQVIEGVFIGLGQLVSSNVFGAMFNAAKAFVERTQALIQGLANGITSTLRRPAEALSNLLNRSRRSRAGTAAVELPPVQISQSVVAEPLVIQPPDPGAWNQTVNQLNKVEAGLQSVRSRAGQALVATNSGISSLGAALANFSPALAAPLFMVTGLIDGFMGLVQAIPAIKTALTGQAATTTAANVAQAGSYTLLATTAGGSAAAEATGAAVSSQAAVVKGGIIGGINAFLSGTYTTLAGTASAAWAAITGPLLPIIILVGAVAAGVFLLYQAFRNNFLGIGDLVRGVADGFRQFFGLLTSGAWQSIAGVFTTIESTVQDIFAALRQLGAAFLEPFQPLIDLFGVRGTGGSSGGGSALSSAMQQTVDAILIPLRILTTSLSIAIRLLGGMMTVLIRMAALLIRIVAPPIRLIVGLVAGLLQLFIGIGRLLTAVGQTILDSILMPFRLVWQAVRLFSALLTGDRTGITQVGQDFTNMLLSPFQKIGDALNVLRSGIQTIGTAVTDFLFAPFRAVWSLIQAIGGLLNRIPQQIVSGLTSIPGAIAQAVVAIPQIIGNALSRIPVVGSALSMIGNAIGSVVGGISKFIGFASGGLVQGLGTGTSDSIPALLSNGEFVVNAQAARSNLRFLDAINSGMDAESVLKLAPVEPRPIALPLVGANTSPPQLQTGEGNVTFQFTFTGDIILAGATGKEAADEFLEEISPRLEQLVIKVLRQRVELSRGGF